MHEPRSLRTPPVGAVLTLALAALAGCGGSVDAAFLGIGLAGLLLVGSLGFLNWISRRHPHRRSTRIARAVFVTLILLTMIGMLALIVMRSGIGKI